MPLQISRLRVWFAAGMIAVCAVVAGAYLSAKWRGVSALKQIPSKIGIDIQQTAQGFTVSKSEGGRTIFKVQASKAVQYQGAGRAVLHDVTIIIYGRDSSRFDQIYGADFEFDPKSGLVQAKGEVQIDLEANPAGLTSPDQAAPKELKNPIHLKTSGLVFNQKTGDAHTDQKVEFNIPQASGSAVGVSYVAHDMVLTLQSQVSITFNGSTAATLNASRATVSKDPQLVTLEKVQVNTGGQRAEAENAKLYLRPDNTLGRVLVEGGVTIESGEKRPGRARAKQLELLMTDMNNTVRTAIFTGAVQMETNGPQPMLFDSDRAQLNFVGKNVLASARAEGNVKVLQHQKAAGNTPGTQDVELSAPAMDFILASGRYLKSASTSGPPQIALRSTSGPRQQTIVTAERFNARFDRLGQLTSVRGAPHARIVTSYSDSPERVSTSNELDVTFHPGDGIETIVQRGNVSYVDGERTAWGDRASYTPADRTLFLTGSPRVVDNGMTITARTMRLDRSTGDAVAEGNVKSTYSDLKAQPGGALLASSSPIHVTARTMVAHRSLAIAVYSGDARLWQDANVVEASSLEFDRDHRFVVAHGSPQRAVSTVLVQTDTKGKVTPITITSSQLTYSDTGRKARFEGGVLAKGPDLTVAAAQLDVFLKAQSAASSAPSQGTIDRIVAQGNIVVSQPTRRATGGQLTYTASEDKFVMTGDSPSIFDAEHGRITGVSLTFFRADDRVLVEGSDSAPTTTRTRVAR